MRAAEGRQSAVRSHNPTAQSTGTAELTHSSVNTHHHHTLTSTPDQHIPSSHAVITPPAINYPLSVNWINEDLPNWQYHHHRHLICYKWLVLLIISLINSKTKHIIFKHASIWIILCITMIMIHSSKSGWFRMHYSSKYNYLSIRV